MSKKFLEIDELISGLNATVYRSSNRVISGVSTDTRKDLLFKLFFPFKGENFDGFDFLDDAVLKKVSGVVCEEGKIPDTKEDVWIFVVKDVLKSYVSLAKFFLKKHRVEVVGITGSNGKTSTKFFLKTLIKDSFNVVCSDKSFNNQIGVSSTIFDLKKRTEVLLLEMGSNQVGDISSLTKIAKPNISVCTNVGRSHLEKLKNLDGVFNEKRQIYNSASTGVFNLDNPWTKKMYKSFKGEAITFSSKKADVVFRVKKMELSELLFEGEILGVAGDARARVFGLQNLNNLMAASSLALALGSSPLDIWENLNKCKSVWGRNQLVKLKNGARVIFDAYNANPDSAGVLINNIKGLSFKGRLFLFFGDMLELGPFEAKFHEELGKASGVLDAEAIFFVGSNFNHFKKGLLKSNFKKKVVVSDSYNNYIASKLASMLNESSILFVKASRGMKLENLICDLEPVDF